MDFYQRRSFGKFDFSFFRLLLLLDCSPFLHLQQYNDQNRLSGTKCLYLFKWAFCSFWLAWDRTVIFHIDYTMPCDRFKLLFESLALLIIYSLDLWRWLLLPGSGAHITVHNIFNIEHIRRNYLDAQRNTRLALRAPYPAPAAYICASIDLMLGCEWAKTVRRRGTA